MSLVYLLHSGCCLLTVVLVEQTFFYLDGCGLSDFFRGYSPWILASKRVDLKKAGENYNSNNLYFGGPIW